MEGNRVLLAVNVPNTISITIMWLVGFLVLAFLFQLAMRYTGRVYSGGFPGAALIFGGGSASVQAAVPGT